MTNSSLLSLAAFLSLVPLTVYAFGGRAPKGMTFWAVTLVAVTGPLLWTGLQFSHAWQAGFATALWLIITASMVSYALLNLLAGSHAGRLAALLMPYLILLGLLAVVWGHTPGQALVGTAPPLWIVLHIALSVLSYALLTIAAVSGLSVFLHERALKHKSRPAIIGLLPSLADSERLELRLLIATEVLLGLSLLTGMGTLYFETGEVLALDHKSLLSLLTFGVIALLLVLRARSHVRGRQAARYVLIAYLLLTLAYPGVKFVTDVLVG